jgi:hypothetical protein
MAATVSTEGLEFSLDGERICFVGSRAARAEQADMIAVYEGAMAALRKLYPLAHVHDSAANHYAFSFVSLFGGEVLSLEGYTLVSEEQGPEN